MEKEGGEGEKRADLERGGMGEEKEKKKRRKEGKCKVYILKFQRSLKPKRGRCIYQ